jgi:soluble lytic murein transglycosylase-like protein
MKIVSLLVSIMLIVVVAIKQATLILPVQLNQGFSQSSILLKNGFGLDNPQLARSIDIASMDTGVSSHFLIALMHTESNFNQKAVSSRGYKGLMQIPYAVFYPTANSIIGAEIFMEKMQIANDNVVNAIILYKGYPLNSERGHQQAKKVLILYEKLKNMEG